MYVNMHGWAPCVFPPWRRLMLIYIYIVTTMLRKKNMIALWSCRQGMTRMTLASSQGRSCHTISSQTTLYPTLSDHKVTCIIDFISCHSRIISRDNQTMSWYVCTPSCTSTCNFYKYHMYKCTVLSDNPVFRCILLVPSKFGGQIKLPRQNGVPYNLDGSKNDQLIWGPLPLICNYPLQNTASYLNKNEIDHDTSINHEIKFTQINHNKQCHKIQNGMSKMNNATHISCVLK